jgi:hypothetical protein
MISRARAGEHSDVFFHSGRASFVRLLVGIDSGLSFVWDAPAAFLCFASSLTIALLDLSAFDVSRRDAYLLRLLLSDTR